MPSLGSDRVALQVATELRAVGSETVLVQAGFDIKVMAGPTQWLVELLTNVDVRGPVGVNARSPDRVAGIVQYQLGAAEVVSMDMERLPVAGSASMLS